MPAKNGESLKLHIPPQQIVYDLRVCGSLVECQETWNWNQSPREPRGPCKEPFSRAARLRMMKEIAQIQWQNDTRYSLISLTYPDHVANRTNATHTIDRSRYIRDMEKLVGRPLGILWRKEWKQRLSGERKGEFTLHWHLLAWSTPWIDHRDIRKLWAKILRTGGPLCTDIREAKTAERAAFYAAKYAAKASSCSLDNGAYLNRQWGRAWGFTRKHLISYYEPKIIRNLSPSEFALLKALASAEWQGIDRGSNQGFTLFSKHGDAIFRSVQKMRLANSGQAR